MKRKMTPTGVEISVPNNEFIVSKSDLKGNVTYCNRTLMRVTGFSEPELLGKQHNLLRHPDMPRSLFNLLWNEISSGLECFVYVKNMCKNGDHYWVFANVTPDLNDQGQVTGYYSVRRAPSEGAVAVVSILYEKMLDAERQSSTAEAIQAGTKVLNQYLSEGCLDYESFVLNLQN